VGADRVRGANVGAFLAGGGAEPRLGPTRRLVGGRRLAHIDHGEVGGVSDALPVGGVDGDSVAIHRAHHTGEVVAVGDDLAGGEHLPGAGPAGRAAVVGAVHGQQTRADA